MAAHRLCTLHTHDSPDVIVKMTRYCYIFAPSRNSNSKSQAAHPSVSQSCKEWGHWASSIPSCPMDFLRTSSTLCVFHELLSSELAVLSQPKPCKSAGSPQSYLVFPATDELHCCQISPPPGTQMYSPGALLSQRMKPPGLASTESSAQIPLCLQSCNSHLHCIFPTAQPGC